MSIHYASGDVGISPIRNYSIDSIHRNLGSLAQFMGDRYGVVVGKRSANVTQVQCPFHTGSLTTSHTTEWENGHQTFKCWKCGYKAIDVIDLTAELERMSRGEAIQLLGDTLGADSGTGGERFTKRPSVSKPQVSSRVTSTEDLTQSMEAERVALKDPISAREALGKYLKYRGWSAETAAAMDIHAAYRRAKGQEHMVMRHPFKMDGKPVGWQDYCKPPLIEPGKHRWRSGYGQHLPEFNLGSAINHVKSGGLDPSLSLTEISICEGVSDTVTVLDTYGAHTPVVGLVGAATVRPQLINALTDYDVVVYADNDSAGESMADEFRKYKSVFNSLAVVHPPDGVKDINDWSRHVGDRVAFAEILELAIIAELLKEHHG